MKQRYVIICLLIILSCRTKEYEYKYYSDGNIKIKAEIQNGKRNGVLIEYYLDGTVQRIQGWKNGIPEGNFQDFYPNGKVKRIGEIQNNKMVSLNTYFESGKILQNYIFDSTGNVTELEVYNEQGVRDSLAYYELSLLNGDTIKIGDQGILKCIIYNRIDSIYKSGQLLITSGFDTTQVGLIPKDTLQVINRINSFDYEYKLIPDKLGKNVIYGVFSHKKNEDAKTLTLTFYEFGYPFYVSKDY